MLAALGSFLACTPTEEAPAPSVLTLSCAPSADGALRATCTVTADPPGDVTLTWGPPTAPERETRTLPAVSETTTTLLWFEPRTAHTVVARDATGGHAEAIVETGDLAVDARQTYSIETGTSTMRRVLHESRCEDSSSVVISSTDGATIWAEDFAPDDPGAEVEAVMMTDRATLLALGTGAAPHPANWVREYDLDGNLVFEVSDFPEETHHDLTESGGYVYVLFHELYEHTDGRFFSLDGFYVLDRAGGRIAQWRLRDHFDLDVLTNVRGIEPIDFSHANSIFVEEDGDVLISFRFMNALASIRGDWTAPDFGEVRWWLAGDPGAPSPASTLDFVSSAGLVDGFQLQHHALRVGDTVTLFDNQPIDVNSRLLTMTIDEETQVADLVHAYTLPVHCDFQGAHYTLPNGNAVATCAAHGSVYEYDAGAPDPRYQMRVQCFEGEADAVFRFVPVDEPLAAAGL